MAVTRINQFTAKPGFEQPLYDFLSATRSVIQVRPGCLSCRLLRGAQDAAQLAIIEEWQSIEAHKTEAARVIPVEKLAEPMAMLARPYVGAYYQT